MASNNCDIVLFLAVVRLSRVQTAEKRSGWRGNRNDEQEADLQLCRIDNCCTAWHVISGAPF